MKKNSFLAGMFGAALAFGFVLMGCQTAIQVTYTEPAHLNMSGVSRVGINTSYTQAGTYISQQLTNTGKYTIATAEELQAWKQWWREQEAVVELLAYQKGATEISPADLVKAYTDNAARADSLYQGKPIKLTGVVTEIGQAGSGNYFVRLGVGNDSVDVYFRPTEVKKIEAVNKNEEVTIFGDSNGFKRPDLADTAEILRILGGGQHVNVINATFPAVLTEYPGKIDTVITLGVDSTAKDGSHVTQRAATNSAGQVLTDSAGKTIYREVTVYDRVVTVTVSYEIMRVKDRSFIGQGTKSAASSQVNSDLPGGLPSVDTLTEQTVNRPLKEVAGEMVPTSQSLSVTLAKSKSKEAKSGMSSALKLVKAKDYAGAASAYGSVYAQYKDFAAGFNQAVLTEVAQGTEQAIELIEALATSSGNPTAQNMLRDMQRRNAANQQAAQQLAE